VIQRQMSDVESQQGTVAHCREGSGGQECLLRVSK